MRLEARNKSGRCTLRSEASLPPEADPGFIRVMMAGMHLVAVGESTIQRACAGVCLHSRISSFRRQDKKDSFRTAVGFRVDNNNNNNDTFSQQLSHETPQPWSSWNYRSMPESSRMLRGPSRAPPIRLPLSPRSRIARERHLKFWEKQKCT